MRTVIAIGLALWATGASAYTVLGSGVSSCGTWLQTRRSGPGASIDLRSWVLGYATRANYDESVTTKIDSEGLWAWIDNYCRANPLKQIVDAAEGLAAELQKRK
jgi:hypothetical protein